MTLHNLEDIKIKDLSLPFEFQTLSIEGDVHVYIYKKSKKARVFEGELLKPYIFGCTRFNVWGDVNGEYTIGQIKQNILNFNPKNYEHIGKFGSV